MYFVYLLINCTCRFTFTFRARIFVDQTVRLTFPTICRYPIRALEQCPREKGWRLKTRDGRKIDRKNVLHIVEKKKQNI